MNKIYSDIPDEPKKEVRKSESPKDGINKILLGIIVVVLIAVVTYFIIQHNRKNNG